MHFVIAWEFYSADQERKELNEKILSKIAPYSSARALSTLYVVKVDSQDQWNKIFEDLRDICKGKPVYFIMTPLMKGGGYNGMIPKNLWDEINKRSQA